MERLRSFIAIELPDTLKDEINRLESGLQKAMPGSGTKWVNAHSIHLTLKFLGNIDISQVNSIEKAMELVSGETAPFQLKTGALGAFPNLRRVQVVWIGLTGGVDRLQVLQQALDSSLARIGFGLETRPFNPHLTLARVRREASLAERQTLGELLARTSVNLVSGINVSAISLIKSELDRSGAIYHRICSTRLKKGDI